MTDLVLDTGALIGIEKNKPRMTALLAGVRQSGDHLYVPATVLAQAWRGQSGQARLAIFLKDRRVTVEPITKQLALAAGVLCQQSATSDIVGATARPQTAIAGRHRRRLRHRSAVRHRTAFGSACAFGAL